MRRRVGDEEWAASWSSRRMAWRSLRVGEEKVGERQTAPAAAEDRAVFTHGGHMGRWREKKREKRWFVERRERAEEREARKDAGFVAVVWFFK